MLTQKKDELTNLLRDAKGKRTLDTFSEETGISKFQLCRIMNGNYKNTPRLSTLKAIAEHSEIPGLFDQIMEVVNATVPDPQLVEEIIFEGEPNAETAPVPNFDFKKNEKLCKAVILDALSSLALPWNTSLPYRHSDFLKFPIQVSVSNHPIKHWSFYFLGVSGIEDMNAVRNFLGDLSLYHPFATEKISLVLTDMSTYHKMLALLSSTSSQPIWNMNFSVILIDLDDIEVKEEELLSLHDSISVNDVLSLHPIPEDDYFLSEIQAYRVKRRQCC